MNLGENFEGKTYCDKCLTKSEDGADMMECGGSFKVNQYSIELID